MVATRKVLPVFLASPSDVADEREAVREAVSSATRMVSDLGWSIELYGWEDTPPCAGRPQAVINHDVDACDVFVGLLWKRWGQPTGEYSSGFQEEFQRAKKRNEVTGCPALWLAFKKINPSECEDPGEQLKAVLAFREERIAARDVLFKEFGDAQELGSRLVEWLVLHVQQLAKDTPSEARLSPQEPAAPLPATAENAPMQVEKKSEPAAEQIRATLGAIADALLTQDGLPAEGKVQATDAFDVARLYLASATMMSDTETGERLGVHEINVIYKHREHLQLTGNEEGLLWRTLIAAAYDNVPGWFWFRDRGHKDLTVSVFFMALKDSDKGVREQALKIATDARLIPDGVPWVQLANLVLSEREAPVRKAGLGYLVAVAPDEQIPAMLDALAAGGMQSDPAVQEALLRLAVRQNADAAFSAAIQGSLDASATLTAIRAAHAAVKTEVLIKALADARPKVREFAARELARQGNLSKDEAGRLVGDASYACRQVAFEALVSMGERPLPALVRKQLEPPTRAGESPRARAFRSIVTNPEIIIARLFESCTHDQLLPLVGWASVDGSIAYRTLALRHFDSFGQRVRADLGNRFAGMESEWYAPLTAKYGEAFVQELRDEQSRRGLSEFIRRKFAAAALDGLGRNGGKEDVPLARGYLEPPLPEYPGDVEVSAVSVLARFGDTSDVDLLLQLAKTQGGDLKKAATQAVLQLAPGVGGAAHALLESGDADLFRDATRALGHEDVQEVRKALLPYIESPDVGIRETVLAYLACTCDEDALAEVLKAYPRGTTTYYNVICWLDRLAYSPLPLREMYRQSIQSRAGITLQASSLP